MSNFLYVPSNFTEYNLFLIYFIICNLVAFLIINLSQVISEKKLDLDKLSAYECGFDPLRKRPDDESAWRSRSRDRQSGR